MITNEEVDAFIRLVDQARPLIPYSADPSFIAEMFDLPTELGTGTQAVQNALFQIIRDEVVESTVAKPFHIRSLRSALVRRFRFQTDFYAYHMVPEWILFGVNESAFRPLSEQDRWLKAIRATYALMAIPGNSPTSGSERDTVVTDAAKRMQSRSYRLGINGADFFFEDGELERCCMELDRLAKKLGGAFVVSALLRHLQQQERFTHGRYLVGRRAQTMPSTNPAPAIPFGYLLNLSLRHMERRTAGSFDRARFEQLVSLAGDVVAILDVETHSLYSFMFTDHANLPRYLQGVMLGDFCLSFRQLVAKDAITMMRGLFNWVDASHMQQTLGWTIADALMLAKATLTLTPPGAINVVWRNDDLVRSSGCSLKTLQHMLPYFTHKTTELNAVFLKPFDAAAAGFDLKPFIWQPGDQRLLLAPSLCSIGFFEALATATRGLYDKSADDKIGQAIEPMLASAFHDHGITPSCVSMKYVVGKKIYDCDLAIESTDAVILFEIKKKSLTKAAWGGDMLAALVDLCRSMIKAQTQLGRQELQLRRDGEIQFVNGSRIVLGNRRIERIAVTLLDWGSVQDRMIVDNVHKILTSATIAATNHSPQQAEAISDGNQLLALLQVQMQELATLKGASTQQFFDCLFLGIPQILFLLDGTRSADDFYANLKTIKTAATGTLDMYHTLTYMKKIRSSATAPTSG